MYPKKLNLGCGFDIKEGWLNDCHSPDLISNVTDLNTSSVRRGGEVKNGKT
jgi:hypothetical protein